MGIGEFFRGFFDFNGDGSTDSGEEFSGFMMLDELCGEQSREAKRQELVNDLLNNAALYGVTYTPEEIEEFLADSERIGLLD